MKVKRFVVGFATTKRTGQFENVKPSIELEVEPDAQADFEEQVKEAFARCRKIVYEQIEISRRKA